MSPHLDENSSAVPALSPGIVRNHEILLREIFDPDHIRDGQLLERAISVNDLRKRGFSVHRIKFVTPQFIKASIESRITGPRRADWRSEGVAMLIARVIREIMAEAEQAFVVIDTASRRNPGHASIYVARPDKGEIHARELRSMLLPYLEERMSVDEAFQKAEGSA